MYRVKIMMDQEFIGFLVNSDGCLTEVIAANAKTFLTKEAANNEALDFCYDQNAHEPDYSSVFWNYEIISVIL